MIDDALNNIILDLIRNDCLEAMKNIPSSSIDLVVTDPPYNLGLFMQERATNLTKMRDNFFVGKGWDNLSFDEWSECMDSFFCELSRVLKRNGSLIIFMSLIRIETIIEIAQKHGFYYKTTGIWHKTNPMPRNMNIQFINSVEGWLYFTNKTKTGTFNNGSKAIHDFVESSVSPKNEKKYGGHPTQKPEFIITHFIELLSKPGDNIMDPFMGSGTTGVVSKRLGRSFTGMEIDEKYFNIALKRIADVKATFQVTQNITDSSQMGDDF